MTVTVDQQHLNVIFDNAHTTIGEFLCSEPEGFFSEAFAPFRSTVFSFTGLTFATTEEARDIRSTAVAQLDGIEGDEAGHRAAVACVNQHYARERSRLLNQG